MGAAQAVQPALPHTGHAAAAFPHMHASWAFAPHFGQPVEAQPMDRTVNPASVIPSPATRRFRPHRPVFAWIVVMSGSLSFVRFSLPFTPDGLVPSRAGRRAPPRGGCQRIDMG